MSIVFQDPMTYLNPVMRIGDQISEALIRHLHLRRREASDASIESLRMVQLSSPELIANSYPSELSGGMGQRAMLAMALCCRPSLLIADEPTTALDASVQAEVLDLIKHLKDTLHMSILLISHDLGVLAEVCDRVYVMYAGKIVESGDIGSIFHEPKHPYTQALMKSMNAMRRGKRDLYIIDGTVPDMLDPPRGCRFHPRCPYAMDVCRSKSPELTPNSTHPVACWLYGDEGERPKL